MDTIKELGVLVSFFFLLKKKKEGQLSLYQQKLKVFLTYLLIIVNQLIKITP